MRWSLLALLIVGSPVFASDQWTEIKSPHFLVVTDAGEKRGREVALRFEQMRQVFGPLVLRSEVKTSRPVQILAFKNTKGIRGVSPLFKGKPVELAGLYQKGRSEDYIALDLSAESDYKWHAVFHEYAHLLLNSNSFEWPPWFDEGFAELFSTIDFSGKDALIGRPPQEDAEMVVTNRLLPVGQLFAVQRDSATYNENGDRRSMFYAESWLIVHYCEEKQLIRPLIQYFAITHEHPDEQEFRKQTGMSFADLNRALDDYVRGNRIMTWKMPAPGGMDAATFSAQPLSANDALVAVAEMHANQSDHAEEAIKELQQAVAADPNNVKAESDLGYAYLSKRDFAEAEPWMEKAAASGSNDPMVHFYYARLLQEEFKEKPPSAEQLERQRKELQAALALDPSLAEAYGLLAYNANQRHDSSEAIAVGEHAVSLDPRNEMYAVNLASSYLAAGKIPEAQAIVDRLRGSKSPQVQSAILSMENYIAEWKLHQDERGMEPPPANDAADEDDTTPPILKRKVRRAKSDSPTQKLQALLVQIRCTPEGSGSLYLKEGDRLLLLRFDSLSEISEAGLSCSSKNRRVDVEYTADGFVSKIAAAE